MKPLLQNISAELHGELHRIGNRHTFTENSEIFAEGDDAEFLPIVVSGRVKMIHFLEPGKEVIINIFEDGETFAVPPVFDGLHYPATAIAMEETILLLIRRSEFLDLLRRSSEFAFAVISWMCEMLRDKTAAIQNLSMASPEYRVARVLLKLSERNIADGPVTIGLRRVDIANMTGLTTETTIRVVRNLAKKQLFDIVHGKIVITDPQLLRQHLGRSG